METGFGTDVEVVIGHHPGVLEVTIGYSGLHSHGVQEK
jgi:hypothetical protein